MKRFCDQIYECGPDGCHLWVGKTIPSGYGRFGCRGAHRVAWELANGRPIPNGLWVLHKCDNPPCVNPKHLYVGTPADNSRDMVRRNRAKTKLTRKQVREVRRFPINGQYRRYIAKLYGVSVSAIDAIQKRRTWRHITYPK